MPKSQNPFSLLRMQELTPSMALELLRRGTSIVITSVIPVLKPVIWSRGPHELWHRFGQHAPILLAFFELLLSPFLLLNIGAGANVFQDRALRIGERHGFDKEPAIGSGRAIAQALFHFIRPACLDGVLPPRLDARPVIWMDTLQPSISLRLFGRHARIVAPASIRIVNIPVGLPGPDQLGDGIDQGMDCSVGSLARADVDAGHDDILDVVVRIHVRGDHYLKVKEHPFPRANQGLEKDRFSRAGSRDGGAYLLLAGRGKGPPGGFGHRLAHYVLASPVRGG